MATPRHLPEAEQPQLQGDDREVETKGARARGLGIKQQRTSPLKEEGLQEAQVLPLAHFIV